jgi:hypothetical protein
MYAESHVIPIFLKACPEWQINLDEERADWGEESPGLYNEISVLAHFIVDSYKNGNVKDFPKIFNTLELIIQEGNDQARDLVIVGLIEDIQNISSWEDFGYDVFIKWLGEESLKEWHHIEKIWEGKTSLSDVIREEKKRD